MRKLPLALALSPAASLRFSGFQPACVYDCNVTVDPRQRSAVPSTLARCALPMADLRAIKYLNFYLFETWEVTCLVSMNNMVKRLANQPLKFSFLTVETAARRANTLISRCLLALAPTRPLGLGLCVYHIRFISEWKPQSTSPRGLYF